LEILDLSTDDTTTREPRSSWVDEAEKARLLAEEYVSPCCIRLSVVIPSRSHLFVVILLITRKKARTASRRNQPTRRSLTPDPLAHGSGGGATYHYDDDDDDEDEEGGGGGGQARGLPHGVDSQGRSRGGKVSSRGASDEEDDYDEEDDDRPMKKKKTVAETLEYDEESD
jgi:hypothetical protein